MYSGTVCINIVKMGILPKAIYRFKTFCIKILTQFFADLERTIINFICVLVRVLLL